MTGEADFWEYWGALKVRVQLSVSVDPIFGLTGYGCDVVQNGSNYVITPKDGVNKRLNLITQKLNIDAQAGPVAICYSSTTKDYVDFTMLNQDLTAHTTKVTFTGL